MDEFKVIQGEGQSVKEFAADTRTSIQKRLEPKLEGFIVALKEQVQAEFVSSLGGGLDKNNPSHQRRVARALSVIVAKALTQQGMDAGNVDITGCLRRDIYQAAHPEVAPQPEHVAKPTGSWLSCVGDDEGGED